jgi:hypothetical protein
MLTVHQSVYEMHVSSFLPCVLSLKLLLEDHKLHNAKCELYLQMFGS